MNSVSRNALQLELHKSQIPGLITWFNGFVGFAEIQNRAKRVENKINDIKMLAPAIARRFQFHSTYMELVRRNRLFLKIEISNYEVNRVISFIAAIRELSKTSTPAGRELLRSRILDGLNPDRDIRELEHEVRAFVHYRQAGCPVELSDSEGGRFDFLVQGPNGVFELECKTFAENIGNPISIDDSMQMFSVLQNVFSASNPITSGILNIKLRGRREMSDAQFQSVVEDFISSGPAAKAYPLCEIQFERKPQWDDLARGGEKEAVIDEMGSVQAQTNQNAMVFISGNCATMVCLGSFKQPKPIGAIFDRLKKASDQFSKERPAMIWGHFLAPSEEGFKTLIERRNDGSRMLDIFGYKLFKSENRKHVCRLRLSADGEQLQLQPSRILSGRTVTTLSGPAYDLTSNVSIFESGSTI